MGAILAIERDGIVYMATDASKSLNETRVCVSAESNLKIHKLPSGILCAAIGPSHVAQRLYLHDEWFILAEGETFDKRFLVERIVPKFYEEIKDMDVWDTDKVIKRNKTTFLFAKGSKLFIMQEDLSVSKCDGVAAISSNVANELMFAYAAYCKESDPIAVLRSAFALATRSMCNVSADSYYVIDTKELEFHKMEVVECSL